MPHSAACFTQKEKLWNTLLHTSPLAALEEIQGQQTLSIDVMWLCMFVCMVVPGRTNLPPWITRLQDMSWTLLTPCPSLCWNHACASTCHQYCWCWLGRFQFEYFTCCYPRRSLAVRVPGYGSILLDKLAAILPVFPVRTFSDELFKDNSTRQQTLLWIKGCFSLFAISHDFVGRRLPWPIQSRLAAELRTPNDLKVGVTNVWVVCLRLWLRDVENRLQAALNIFDVNRLLLYDRKVSLAQMMERFDVVISRSTCCSKDTTVLTADLHNLDVLCGLLLWPAVGSLRIVPGAFYTCGTCWRAHGAFLCFKMSELFVQLENVG